MVEVGFERDTLLQAQLPIRWWLYLHVDNARPQRPRMGVVDRGFTFARGGRAASDEQARTSIRAARQEAEAEWRIWQHQPSHMLGPNGELVPLDAVLPELEP